MKTNITLLALRSNGGLVSDAAALSVVAFATVASMSAPRTILFPLLLLGVAYAPMAAGQSSGTFTATGNMITPRFLHTATLLPDGRVLIAGGDSSYATSSSAEASAELYVPSTGTFIETGSMTTARDGHTATLLANGKVLIVGGGPRIGGVGYPLASAELYDPASGTFAATGDMNVARTLHTATLLNNGRVLIAGGNVSLPNSAELYDPDTGTFSLTGEMSGSFGDPATLLPNGYVLIYPDVYNPSTGLFSPTGNRVGGDGPTATLLPNGKVLVAGGVDEDSDVRIAELYDPSTGTFSTTGNLGIGREQDAAVLLPDGTVLVVGGHGGVPVGNGGYDNYASAEIYNPATGAFSNNGSMLTGRDLLQATLLNSGQVLITGGNEYYPFGAGGRDPSHPEVRTAELYTPIVLTVPPVLLSLSGDGSGPGAIQHAGTYQIVSPDNPASPGEVLIIYCTGLADVSAISPYVAIGGHMAEVLWFGDTPGYPGLNQINVQVPDGIVTGPATPVRLNYIGRSSNEVTIAVK